MICTSNRDREGQYYAFAQVFRGGCIELVGTVLSVEQGEPAKPTVFPRQYELSLVQHDLPVALQVLETLGIPAPAYLCVSLLNIHQQQIGVKTAYGMGYRILPPHLPDIVAAPVYLETFEAAPANMAGQALDAVWNVVGVDQSETPLPGRAR
ncbi:hypothetical protein [Burkholderia orbicola]|uniref:hypothetical protein n=1 Tax=Burkholderia orbicola TaxID=2978683 RepID=UPI002FDFC9BC